MLKHLNLRWVAINRNTSLQSGFNFRLSRPTGQLSSFVQAIWSASVCQSDSVEKSLYSDAGSGILFNLNGGVKMGNDELPKGVIMLPVKKQAEKIVLAEGAQLAGIRFHPAIGYGVLGRHYDKPTLLLPENDQQLHLYQIYSELRMQSNIDVQIEALNFWVEKNLDCIDVIPSALERALDVIEQGEIPGRLSGEVDLSQRQIERIFKHWLLMTPKHYQRILRVKKAIQYLRLDKKVNLTDVSLQFGFSDQAHMTREFRSIAGTTPGQV